MAEQQPPARVPTQAQQAGDVRARWAWAEATVWTDRMLAALESGANNGVWFRLMDKVFAPANLKAAWTKVQANDGAAGTDRMTVATFERHAEAHLEKLSRQLRDRTYRPSPVLRKYIPKPGGGERPLGIPSVSDRVVQTALLHVLEPIFEHDFAEHSYGFRPGRGCKLALRRVDALLKSGHEYVVDVDLKGYFDSIPQHLLMQRVRERVTDGSVLKLLELFLRNGVMDGQELRTPTAGTPQGAVISPLLSNIYLNPLDQLMAGKGYEMVRYADDFVILCTSREQAQAALQEVQTWTAQWGLTLHPEKTRVVHWHDPGGFEFLGYRFERGMRFPRKKSMDRLKDTVRRLTPRTSGFSLSWMISQLSPTLKGWFEYFKHAHRAVFKQVDGWIRGRLRSILRRRAGRRGRSRGRDHQRWPNAMFIKAGLFTLEIARAEICRSAKR